MSVSRRRSGATLLAILLSLASLGLTTPVIAADSPEAAVNELLDAVSAGDLARAETLVCEAERGAVREMFDIGGQLGLDPSEMAMQPLTIAIDDRETELVEQADDTATVRVSGTLTVDVDEDQVRELVRTMLESGRAPGDPPISDEDLEFMVPLIASAFSSGQPLDEEITLILEGGEWLVCGGLGEPAEDPGEFPAAVSFEGLCGLVSIDQMSSLGVLEYDSSQGFETTCTYSLSSYEDYHTATVSLNEGYRLEDLRQVFGVDQEIDVAGNGAFLSGDQLFVEVADDVLQVALYLGETPPLDVDAQALAVQIAELFIPVLPELQAEEATAISTPQPEGPSLCESLSLETVNALGPLRFDQVDGSEGSCMYTSTSTEGGFAFLSLSLDPSLPLDQLITIFPDGEDLQVAGRPAYAVMGQLFVGLEEGVLTVAAVSDALDSTGSGDSIEYAVAVAELVMASLARDAG